MPVSDDPRRQSAERIDVSGNPATVERVIESTEQHPFRRPR